MAAEFGWWPMSPWLSPGAAWFIFINVVVGAIAVMTSSRGQQDDGRGEPGTRRKLVRTASTVVLDSLRSISIFSSHSAGDYSVAAYPAPASQLHHVQEERCYTFREETREVAPQLRVPEAAASVAEEQTVVLPPQSAQVAAAALGTSATASESHVEEDGEPSISFDEAYALARARRQAVADDTVARMPGKWEPLAEVKVRACGRGRGTEEVEGKAEVNERAEQFIRQFIRQFREELKLERINSILNYTHALRRGAGAATPRSPVAPVV